MRSLGARPAASAERDGLRVAYETAVAENVAQAAISEAYAAIPTSTSPQPIPADAAPASAHAAIRNPQSAFPEGHWEETPHGPCFCVEVRYPLGYQHGAVPLDRLLGLPDDTLSQLGRSPRFAGQDRRRLLFFDTETTGLAGGTGTYVFLVGLGYFEGDEFVVRQLFLPELGAERALLHLLNRHLGASGCLVSFNGRAFDWPLIEARFTLSRMRPAQAEPLHLDLLAPARRVWKDWLPSCALGHLEAHALRFRRRGDVPGWLIPTLYFEYLRGGPAHALRPVLEHNRLDVLSLLALAGHLGGLLHAPDAAPLECAECYGLGRLYEDLGNYGAAVRLYKRALAGVLSAPLRAVTLQRLTAAHKKLRQHHEALRIWEELVAGGTTLVFPYIELAKHYEHHTREYAEAVALVERALALCADPWVRPTVTRAIPADLERRRIRLATKLAKTAPPHSAADTSH
ncbi:MAG: ribonuclease H-like domain-containing protein [Chloroflexota bacterium]|nr:ribonuclease H-like domain-containing protein [Chloroflexota bacterium]